jgi:3-dehydroquinate synthase
MNHIVIQKDFRSSILEFLISKKYSQIIVLVDENTKKHCYERLAFKSFLPAHELIEIKSGEEEKNLQTCTKIWQKMTEMELDRKALFINLGGGVIGDMGGFCASTYKRGIDFIQIPTTLLSMVDASVGGKLGIDFSFDNNTFKNHIGVFRVPDAVLVSTEFLETLPLDELRSGYAEVLKHCLIADVQKWKKLIREGKQSWHLCQIQEWQANDWEDVVSHSIQIKDKITTEDPTEKGLRKTLNFGHTLGHAVESFYLITPKKLLHGEAIAVGIICESYLSLKRNLISEEDFKQISECILSVYGKVSIPNDDLDAIIELTKQDKKNEYSEVQFALIGPIGFCGYGISVGEKEMKEALEYYIKAV